MVFKLAEMVFFGEEERRWYDAEGNLLKVSRPEQYDATTDSGEGYAYTYDAMNRLTQITGPNGVVKKRFVYDLQGNRIQEKRYLEEQSLTSARGRVLTIAYAYDKDNRLVEVKDSTGALLTYQYDGKNRKTVERSKINGESIQLLQYTYDAGGRLTQVIRGADQEGCGKSRVVVYYDYDQKGNNTRILLPTKAQILREYDGVNRLVKEVHLDKAGGIHNETRFSYDRAGNLIGIRDNQGGISGGRRDIHKFGAEQKYPSNQPVRLLHHQKWGDFNEEQELPAL